MMICNYETKLVSNSECPVNLSNLNIIIAYIATK